MIPRISRMWSSAVAGTPASVMSAILSSLVPRVSHVTDVMSRAGPGRVPGTGLEAGARPGRQGVGQLAAWPESTSSCV